MDYPKLREVVRSEQGKVSDQDVQSFYDENRPIFGRRSLGESSSDIRRILGYRNARLFLREQGLESIRDPPAPDD